MWLLGKHWTIPIQTWTTLVISLNPINLLIGIGAITKTGTLTTPFHKPEGEANMYIQFGYGPMMIFNHTWGQVSGSINADPINMIHTCQKSTKLGLNKELDGYFRSSKIKLPKQYFMNK